MRRGKGREGVSVLLDLPPPARVDPKRRRILGGREGFALLIEPRVDGEALLAEGVATDQRIRELDEHHASFLVVPYLQRARHPPRCHPTPTIYLLLPKYYHQRSTT